MPIDYSCFENNVTDDCAVIVQFAFGPAPAHNIGANAI
jgi:hypothetical protein